MEKIGRVLWWSDKDKNGIITDPRGNEYYFDESVLKTISKKKVISGAIVLFDENTSVIDVVCAKNVEIPLGKSKEKLEKIYQIESVQLSLF
ncbi:MAG: hypothetical protein HOP07_10350 [Bacteriovoracaceae bacterium]|nr:hypothetical protein [Bacteriovoracaceae bacterium]